MHPSNGSQQNNCFLWAANTCCKTLGETHTSQQLVGDIFFADLFLFLYSIVFHSIHFDRRFLGRRVHTEGRGNPWRLHSWFPLLCRLDAHSERMDPSCLRYQEESTRPGHLVIFSPQQYLYYLPQVLENIFMEM